MEQVDSGALFLSVTVGYETRAPAREDRGEGSGKQVAIQSLNAIKTAAKG